VFQSEFLINLGYEPCWDAWIDFLQVTSPDYIWKNVGPWGNYDRAWWPYGDTGDIRTKYYILTDWSVIMIKGLDYKRREAAGEKMMWNKEGSEYKWSDEWEDAFQCYLIVDSLEAWIRKASTGYNLKNLTVWDLNQICHNLRRMSLESENMDVYLHSRIVFSVKREFLLFNIRGNIVKTLKLVYGAENVDIRRGVLGEVNPATVSILYDMIKQEEIEWSMPLLDIKVKYKEYLGEWMKPENLKTLVLQCMRKNLSLDGNVTVDSNVPNYTEKDLANTIGEVVVKNQEVLMRNLL
jgi:hypothetical protein